MKKYIQAIIAIFLFVASYSQANSNQIDNITFATAKQASELLKKEDAYTKRWSTFDIQARLHKTDGNKQELINLTASQTKDWQDDEKNKIKTAIGEINARISSANLHLNIPHLVFIKSSMQSEGDADGYTRDNLIVLKDNIATLPKEKLTNLLIHELFHILTRDNKAFREKMYNIIGFHLTNEIIIPPPMSNLLIANPDAPVLDSYITVKVGDKTVDCVMVLFSRRHYQGGNFFDYMDIGLAELQDKDNHKVVALSDENQPIVYRLEEASNFFEQVGINTPYIINPEEILAENFVYALIDKKGLPDQEIVNKIIDYLQTDNAK